MCFHFFGFLSVPQLGGGWSSTESNLASLHVHHSAFWHAHQQLRLSSCKWKVVFKEVTIWTKGGGDSNEQISHVWNCVFKSSLSPISWRLPVAFVGLFLIQSTCTGRPVTQPYHYYTGRREQPKYPDWLASSSIHFLSLSKALPHFAHKRQTTKGFIPVSPRHPCPSNTIGTPKL
jgi:hypothetical protein